MSASPTSAGSVVDAIQRHLSAIYRIEAHADASDFLLGEEARTRLASREGLPGAEGQLLILEEQEQLWIGLYLDARVRGGLEARDPYARLDAENLSPFLTAVEETSHFLYLLWSLGNGRPVSKFELELQAEVDKFASSALVLRGQGWRGWQYLGRRNLSGALFGEVAFDERLDEAAAGRYHAAHRLAARYCRALESRYLAARGPARIPPLLKELRRFYRCRGNAKIRHILRN